MIRLDTQRRLVEYKSRDQERWSSSDDEDAYFFASLLTRKQRNKSGYKSLTKFQEAKFKIYVKMMSKMVPHENNPQAE